MQRLAKSDDQLGLMASESRGIHACQHVMMMMRIMLWEPYPSHHNGLFSPLLVLRDFAAREADHSRSEPLQVSGSASAGRVICGTDLAGCVSVPGDFLRPQGAFPPGFYPLSRGVGFIARRLRRP